VQHENRRKAEERVSNLGAVEPEKATQGAAPVATSPARNEPARRRGSSSDKTGREMIVWGGLGSGLGQNALINTGARYCAEP